jgi:hypothetical protein
MLLLNDLHKYIVHTDKYRLGISKSEPIASKPVQYSDGVILTSKKYPPQTECPIAHEPVQYPDGFA